MERGNPAAEELDHFWDALVERDGSGSPSADLDPEVVAVVGWLHAQRLGPAPAATRHRIWRRVDTLTRGDTPLATGSRLPGVPMARTGPLRKDPWRARVTSRLAGRWALTHLATAALLLLTLVMVWWQTPGRDRPLQTPPLIQALDVVPSDVAAELLVDALFTVEDLPAGDVEAIFYRITLPPGTSLTDLPGPVYQLHEDRVTAGVGVEIIQAGTYRLQLDAPIRVQRADSASGGEEIPAGTEVVLGPGDRVIYPDYAAGGTLQSGGEQPVVITGVAIVSAAPWSRPAPYLPPGVTAEQLAYAGPVDWRSLAGQPVSMSLWQLTLPPGTSVGPYEATLEALQVETGTITRGIVRPGETAPHDQPLAYSAGMAVPSMALRPGVRRIITSTGDEPATLLVLSIEPAGDGTRLLEP